MYGLATKLNTIQPAIGQYQPTEEEQKISRLSSQLWDYRGIFEQSRGFAALVDANIISPEEARRIMDINGYLGLLDEIDKLTKP